MCGIAGMVVTNPAADVSRIVRRMVTSLRHRGPDNAGCLVEQCRGGVLGLGHTRLAILDTSSLGNQPMSSDNGRFSISFNGEVYNFQQLRQELQQSSRFRSNSDTEVILEAFAKRGLDALRRFRGMFALAIWDRELQSLVLARDVFGIKPLYYVRTKEGFLFASEIRALLDTGLVTRRLSQAGLHSYLRTGSVEDPHTIIEEVRSLPPGYAMRVQLTDDGISVSEPCAYDSIFPAEGVSDVPRTREEAVARLRDILAESVRLHRISDVPLGAFLSGGIDSSAIVALTKTVTKEPPDTFSVIFEEKQFSERDHARAVANAFGTKHTEVLLTEQALVEQLPDAFNALDQPSSDGFNTYVVAKAVKEAGVTVALSGLGGDELFAGYSSFRRSRLLRPLRHVPPAVRRGAAFCGRAVLNGSVQRTKLWDMVASDLSPEAAYTITRRMFSDREVCELMGTGIRSSQQVKSQTGDDIVNSVSHLEMQGYMANTLLRDSDVMSMAHALEVRVPFVDVEVARFVLSMPGEWKIRGKSPKPFLVDALDGALPESVWNRPKMGFGLPFERWMQTALRPELEAQLSRASSRNSSAGVNPSQVSQVWNRFIQQPKSEKWTRPWTLYVLYKWCELHGVSQ